MSGHRILLSLAVFCLIFALPYLSLSQEVVPVKADRVVVVKSKRVMMLMKDGGILKEYRISLGKNPQGHKLQAGDARTPEGDYILDWRNPKSKFHLSLHISYPNEQDWLNASRLGFQPGGNIMIHGLPKGMEWLGGIHAFIDWTNGCIAVTNEEMEEIWRYVADGTPVRIDF